jgi:hypothetical protein
MFILSKKAASSIAAAVAGKVRLFITDTGKIATKDDAGTVINYVTSTELSDGLAGKLSNANSGVTAGSYGGASSIPVLAINSKGQITSASTVAAAGGGGGGGPPWVDLAVLTANGFASGFASGTSIKLQVAKDANGYIWIQGVIRNTSASANTNAPVVLPNAYMVRVQNTSANISSTAFISNLNGTDTPVALQTYYFDASTQLINKSGSWAANGIYFIAPSILGIALNP